MTEKEKAAAGYLYDANYDSELIGERIKCDDLCYEYNACKPSDVKKRGEILKKILPHLGDNAIVTSPFYCDYGYNITIGKSFYSNRNLNILDGGKVTIGDNVFIAPNCCITTAGHALDTEKRNKGLEVGLPITIGDNVWIGANVCILPGVTIGSDTVIGAGSVVTHDIPSGVIAVGNPCRVLRKITQADAEKYKVAD